MEMSLGRQQKAYLCGMGVSFEEFNFNRQILNAIADAGYTEATPIQQKAIPPIMNGQDVMGIAQTGTGKTAAYVLPIIMKLKYAQGEACRVRSLFRLRANWPCRLRKTLKPLPPIPICGLWYYMVALAQKHR
jgi:hypothetical protein